MNNLSFQGETHRSAKFTSDSILLLPELVKIGFGLNELNELTGVAQQNIRKILDGKTWRQLHLFDDKVVFHKRKATDIIQMSQDLYFRCVKYWGNTVLNKMIAKGILSV